MQKHYPNCSFYDEYIDRYPKKANVRTVTFTKITVLTWSECRDSNPGPLGPEPSAIPSFAIPR